MTNQDELLRKRTGRVYLRWNTRSLGLVAINFPSTVRRESFEANGIAGITGNTVPVVTSSTFNRNCELTSRRFPTGHETKWEYRDHSDPLNQGNLAQITLLPQAGVESDQPR